MSTYIEVTHKESGKVVRTGDLSDERAASQLPILEEIFGSDYTYTIVFDNEEEGN